jgi:integrase
MPPIKPKNKERRSREHLTPDEIESLISKAIKVGRHGYRDSTMILMAYRHGLRVSELIALKWSQVDLKQGLLYVNRRKNGMDSTSTMLN